MKRTDFDYICMDDGDRVLSLDDFQARFNDIVEHAKESGGENITVRIDADSDIRIEFLREETEDEKRHRENREREERERETARRFRDQEHKWRQFKQLADELGVDVDVPQ